MKSIKQEITLMTLLANEATKDSADILKKYNKPKPQNHADLEVKLAELYFEQDDKIQIEKELANIHPHKNWIVKSLNLVNKDDKNCDKCLEATKKQSETDKFEEIKNVVTESVSKFSDFNGSKETNQPIVKESTRISTIEIVGIIGVIGFIGLTFIVVSKNLSK
jgi:hypothetical protein